MQSFYQWLLENFNTREIATGIWLLAITSFLIYWRKTRHNLIGVFQAAINWKLLVMFGSLAIYITGLCLLLSKQSLWTTSQISATVLWFFLSGVVLLGRSLSPKEDDRYFKNLIWDSFKVVAIFEFVVVAHTFSIMGELLLVPVFAILGALLAVSDTKDVYRPAKLLFEMLTVVIMLSLLWYSTSQIWSTPGEFFTTTNGRNLLLPAFLTIGSVPFFYLWYCTSSLETSFIRIGFKTFQSDELERYAKHRFSASFFLKPWLMRRAVRQFQILPANNNEDVDKIIEEIYIQEREAKCPPMVDEREGWSPYLARDFLKEYSLKTEDYHFGIGDGLWGAMSPYVDLDDDILPSRAAFYLEGRRMVVTTLKLTGTFYNAPDASEPSLKFREITVFLTEKALKVSARIASSIIPYSREFEVTYNETMISSRIEEYAGRKGFDQYFVLSHNHEQASTS